MRLVKYRETSIYSIIFETMSGIFFLFAAFYFIYPFHTVTTTYGVPSLFLVSPTAFNTQTTYPTDPPAVGTNSMNPMALMGLGPQMSITPTDGNVLVNVIGTAEVENGGDEISLQLQYGTGNPPYNNESIVGVGSRALYTIDVPSSEFAEGNAEYPFNFTGVLTGLTPGTKYWFDIAANVSEPPGTSDIVEIEHIRSTLMSLNGTDTYTITNSTTAPNFQSSQPIGVYLSIFVYEVFIVVMLLIDVPMVFFNKKKMPGMPG